MSFKMAMRVPNLTGCGIKLLSNAYLKNCLVNATRQLYAPASMGMNGYLNAREYVKSQFLNVDNVFRDKMKDFVQKPENSMIFTEDLKTMVHLVEKTPEDLELLLNMVKKFHTQSNLRFGTFVFGTVVMRAFYHMNEPEWALKAFKDPELNNFFDQIMTFQLLMDMLYNNGMYKDCREIYDIIKTKNVGSVVHPKNSVIIVLGACYKENTEESLNYGLELFKELQARGFEFPRRAITFLAALALNQNKPDIALEIASSSKNVRYIDVRCIKLEAFARLKRFDEMLVFFRASIFSDNPTRRKEAYFSDTYDRVLKIVEAEGFGEDTELVKVMNQLKMHDFIQPMTLDEHLTQTIVGYGKISVDAPTHVDQQGAPRNFYAYQRQSFNKHPQSRYNQRPGLRDLI